MHRRSSHRIFGCVEPFSYTLRKCCSVVNLLSGMLPCTSKISYLWDLLTILGILHLLLKSLQLSIEEESQSAEIATWTWQYRLC